jgi:hypothetical protein
MSTGRTILALLISLSVALLPAAAGAGVSSKSPDQADMSMTEDVSMTEDMHDCCPPMANPCAMDNCGSMAICALKCFSFAGTSSEIIVFSATSVKMIAPFERNPFSSQTGAPPFRPPRA